MPRENNYLLGYGERLTKKVTITKASGPKNPPYDFFQARQQMAQWLSNAVLQYEKLPIEACPADQVTAVVTMHPRYTSKSDFPLELFNNVGVRAVGGRAKKIQPREWGVIKHPQEALSDEIFVMGSRRDLVRWAKDVSGWTKDHAGAEHLMHIEALNALEEEDKVRSISNDREKALYEVVLHDCPEPIFAAFRKYATSCKAEIIKDKVREVKGLTFVPVYVEAERVHDLAKFSFVRVVRAMPAMRPMQPNILRTDSAFHIELPDGEGIDQSIRVAVFDGGLPSSCPNMPWVNLIEPAGIGNPVPYCQEHGLAVTSALSFGPIERGKAFSQPLCQIDHVRVIDTKTGANGDFEYYDVLDRILDTLDTDGPYDFVNLSLGPDIPVDDDDVTRWTASLDDRFSNGITLSAVAVGNSGRRDAASGLNRIQPPSDAVNVLSIGACDIQNDPTWKRADYSSVGPGRCPGIVKPDGVIFGGSDRSPFLVLAPSITPQLTETQGTSFAAPYALRTAVAVRAQLGGVFTPLTIRALLVHRADPGVHPLSEVGWGRLETDYGKLITTDDDEALVIYQGELPVGQHLRVPVPLPEGKINGFVTVSATLAISPEVDPSYPNVYTRGGLEVAFRPDSTKFKPSKDGRIPAQANTKSFFSQKKLYGVAEYTLREGYKWEPCLKASERLRATTLNSPCFDIYYHTRGEGVKIAKPKPISYSLVVSVKAPSVVDFYNRVARAYSNILVPLQPRIRIQVR